MDHMKSSLAAGLALLSSCSCTRPVHQSSHERSRQEEQHWSEGLDRSAGAWTEEGFLALSDSALPQPWVQHFALGVQPTSQPTSTATSPSNIQPAGSAHYLYYQRRGQQLERSAHRGQGQRQTQTQAQSQQTAPQGSSRGSGAWPLALLSLGAGSALGYYIKGRRNAR